LCEVRAEANTGPDRVQGDRADMSRLDRDDRARARDATRLRAWLPAGAALALAASLSVLVYVRPPWLASLIDSRIDRDRAPLVAAVGAARPLEARLTGGFAWGAYRGVTRGGAAYVPPIAVRSAALELERRAALEPSAERLAARGVGRALIGDLDRAGGDLEEALALAPANARIASDLAAVYSARAERAPDRYAELMAHAVEAASRATDAEPALNEAWFNLALSLEAVRSIDDARAAWARVLALDAAGPWADEARRHQADLDRRTSDSPPAAAPPERERLEDELFAAWGHAVLDSRTADANSRREEIAALAARVADWTKDPFAAAAAAELSRAGSAATLAAGHIAYADGRKHYARDRYAEAADAFTRALAAFTRAGSVFRNWAELELGVMRYQQRDLGAASAHFRRVDGNAARHGYTIIGAQTRWMRGLVALQRGEIDTALAFYQDAIAGYETARDAENAVAVLTTAADTMRLAGDYDGGWRLVSRALARAQELKKPLRRFLLFTNAALFADGAELPHAALAFQSAAVAAARDRGGVGPEVDALTRRAVFRARLASPRMREAIEDLDAAAALLPAITEVAIRNYLSAQVSGARARVLAASDPAEAARQADIAAQAFTTLEPAEVPRLLLVESRAKRLAGDPSARLDLERGIEVFEKRWQTLSGQALRAAYGDDAWGLFEEMIDLRLRAGEAGDAFAFAERGRARLNLGAREGSGARGASPTSEAGALTSEEAAFYYSVLPDRTVRWAVHRGQTRVFSIDLSRSSLQAQVERYAGALERGDASADALGAALHARLIAPALPFAATATRLIIAPAGPLHRLAFASLWDDKTRTRLVERFAISHITSWDMLARRATPRPKGHARTGVLAVSTRASEPGLPLLPMAAAEARDVRAVYGAGSQLTDGSATRDAVLRQMPGHGVIHIATHARAGTESPLDSYLLLDGAGKADRVFGHDIAAVDLEGTRLVVLAACDTARGRIYRGAGPASLAQPFLAAGAQGVVASLWPVDDRETRALMVDFHRGFQATGDAALALRRAQLDALHRDPSNRRTWAAFVFIGT
jgi:CHAT domain-containing protein